MTLDTIGTIQEPCSINKMMYSREGFSANDQSEGFVRCCVNFNCVSPQGRHDMQ